VAYPRISMLPPLMLIGPRVVDVVCHRLITSPPAFEIHGE
jgi:hypothetical protein